MKKLHLLILIVTSSITMHAQDLKTEVTNEPTKIDAFTSKTGILTKFTDYNLTSLNLTYGLKASTRIRKINSGEIVAYFYQIEKSGKYGGSTASIEYSDLLELIKALDRLKLEVTNDLESNPDYLENKFITEDGFQIGYYVSKGKINWYMRLKKYGSDNTVFIKDVDNIEESFNEAKSKIEILKG